MVVTIAERKHRRIEATRAAGRQAMGELATFAKARGGRFLVFGSMARGDLALSSDFDVVVDFPAAEENAAYEEAERVIAAQGLRPDVILIGNVSANLMERVRRDAIVLG